MFKFLLNLFGGKCSCSCSIGSQGGKLEDFVGYVARALVDYPDEVRLSTEENGDNEVIRISCRKEDIGKIVGKHGKTIMAIRSLVSGAAGRQKKRVSVEVVD